MEVTLKRTGVCKFEATSGMSGKSIVIDGPPSLGGKEEGVRPMETVLMGLASCSAMDLLLILGKQRQEPEDLDIKVTANRVDDIPAVFSDIHIEFEVSGSVDPKKLAKAADLSVEKYCSVAKMLAPTVEITHSTKIKA